MNANTATGALVRYAVAVESMYSTDIQFFEAQDPAEAQQKAEAANPGEEVTDVVAVPMATTCTSDDPSDHQGDTCPVHEGDSRTFLAHLNLTLPADAPDPHDQEARLRLVSEIEAALTVGWEGAPEGTLLARCSDLTVVDGEEV